MCRIVDLSEAPQMAPTSSVNRRRLLKKAQHSPFDRLRASGSECLRISVRGEPVEP
jgi:hypothetical protein